ncbi:MAG: ribonuclease III domain-containing protein [Bacilli bacterium]|nr:ribonuclease III domain-containing protein [Bacilli bacterium]
MRNSSRNVLALAYLGDSVYEIYIREYLLNKGIEKVNELQKESVKYVSARGQSKYLKDMMDSNLLTEEELSIVYRARNHKGSSHPKNTDIVTYKYATGLEALIGWLYLENNQDRIDEIMNYILNNNH